MMMFLILTNGVRFVHTGHLWIVVISCVYGMYGEYNLHGKHNDFGMRFHFLCGYDIMYTNTPSWDPLSGLRMIAPCTLSVIHQCKFASPVSPTVQGNSLGVIFALDLPTASSEPLLCVLAWLILGDRSLSGAADSSILCVSVTLTWSAPNKRGNTSSPNITHRYCNLWTFPDSMNDLR